VIVAGSSRSGSGWGSFGYWHRLCFSSSHVCCSLSSDRGLQRKETEDSDGPDESVRIELRGHPTGEVVSAPTPNGSPPRGERAASHDPPLAPPLHNKAPPMARGLSEPAGQIGSAQVTMGEVVDLTLIRSGRLYCFLSFSPSYPVSVLKPVIRFVPHFSISRCQS
jgi:hypothetical protein